MASQRVPYCDRAEGAILCHIVPYCARAKGGILCCIVPGQVVAAMPFWARAGGEALCRIVPGHRVYFARQRVIAVAALF